MNLEKKGFLKTFLRISVAFSSTGTEVVDIFRPMLKLTKEPDANSGENLSVTSGPSPLCPSEPSKVLRNQKRMFLIISPARNVLWHWYVNKVSMKPC